MKIRWFFLSICILFSSAVYAHELSFLVGHLTPVDESGSTYSWQVDFRENFHRYFAWSGSYVNEGHVAAHKRDGLAAQIWGSVPLFDRHFSLALGGGVYRYYDTRDIVGGSYKNDHGWAAIGSISTTYYINKPWFIRLTVNRIMVLHDMDTDSYLLGVGYDLAANDNKGKSSFKNNSLDSQKTGVETTVFAGAMTANNLNNQAGVANGIEFRTGVMKYLDWTVIGLHESDSPSIQRDVLGTQLWLVNRYFNNRFAIGVGAGPGYFLDKKYSHLTKSSCLAEWVSIMMRYQFANHWLARITWNRLGTRYNHDSDEFVFGAGYRW